MTVFRHRVTGPGPAGDVWTNTIYSQSSSSLTAVHTAFLQWTADFYGTTMQPLWSTQMEATNAVTDQLDPTTWKNAAQISSAITVKGTGSGLQLPQRAAVVVGLRTALPTRSGRGRIFVPAPDSSHLDPDGTLAAAARITIASGMSAAIATFNGTSQVGVAHKATKTLTSVNSVTVGQVVGVQRRRTNKVANDYQSAAI